MGSLVMVGETGIFVYLRKNGKRREERKGQVV